MNEHLVAARAAIADLIEYHERGWRAATEAMAALLPLDLTEPPSTERPGPEPSSWERVCSDADAFRAALPHAPEPAPADFIAEEEQGRGLEPALAVEPNVEHVEPAVALATERHRCECGRCFTRAQALGSHRRHCQAERAAAFAADVELARTQTTYRCDTCSAVFTQRPDLSKHTVLDHKRGPTHAENTALADRAVRA